MKKLWLRSPDGEVREVDPKEYDVPAMLKDGFTRTGRPEPGMLKALPGIGGAVGGFMGGTAGAAAGGVGAVPGAIGGAALGGAGGEAMRQHIGRAMGVEQPDTPQAALAAMAGEGAWQGGMQATGVGLAKGASAVAKPLMQAAMRSTPEVAKTALRTGVTATRKGLTKAGDVLKQHGARTASMVRQNVTRFDPQAFLAGAEQSLATNLAANRTPASFVDAKTFQRLSSHFLRRNQGQMDAQALQKLKQMADQIAGPLWKKQARGEALTGVESAKARWYKAVADHAREQLEQTTPDIIEAGKRMSLREANALTGEVIEMRGHLGKQVRTAPGLGARIAGHTAGPAIGGGVGYLATGHDPMGAVGGALVGAGATSPAVLSMLAQLLNSPAAASALQQVPRGIGLLGTQSR